MNLAPCFPLGVEDAGGKSGARGMDQRATYLPACLLAFNYVNVRIRGKNLGSASLEAGVVTASLSTVSTGLHRAPATAVVLGLIDE
jgi:hypothetical protein